MNIRFTSLLVALLGFASLAQPVLAASKKDTDRTAALVAALQAVSPDPLGGRLGLAASQSRPAAATPVVAPAPAGRNVTRFDLDQRAYVIWKSSQKS